MKRKSNFQTSIGKSLKFIAAIAILNLMLLLFPMALEAATYYSRVAAFTFAGAGNNWSTSSSGGTLVAYPGTTHSYIIQPGHTVTLGAAQTVAGITVNSGGTLIAGSNTLTINGNWTHDGTFTSSGMVTFTTVAAASISGGTTLTLNNLTVGAATTLTLNNNVTVAGNVTMTVPSGTNTGITIAGTNSLNVTGTMNLPVPGNNNRNVNVNVNAGSLTVGGLFTMSATTSGSRLNFLNISTGTVNLNGGITTGTTACRIVFSGNGTLNINGVVTGGPPAITESTGTINFNRASAQTVWNETYYNLTLSGGGIKTTTTVTVNNILSMEGTATVSAAPTYGASATLRYNRTANQTAGAEWPATFAATGGVIIDNSGDITTNGNKVFNLNVPLTINSGAVLIPAAGNTFSFGGDLINNGTWTPSNGAVTIALTRTSQSIGSFETTGLVTMSKASGTATFTGNINGAAFTKSGAGTINFGTALTHTFTGDFALGTTVGSVIGNSSTINVNSSTATAWNGTGTAFTAGASTVNFGAAGPQTISATGVSTFNNLTFSNSGVKTIVTANTVVGNIFTLEGSATSSLAPTYGASATLRYNRTLAQNAGAEWLATFAATGGVIIDNVGAINPNGNKVFNQDVPLTINSGATLSPAAGNTFSFGGDFINSGTWTPSTGDVTIALDRVSQNIGSLSTSGTVNMTKATGAATFTGNINCGTLSLGAAGTLNLGSGLTHVITGGLAGTAGTLNGNSSTLRIGGAVTASIAFNANTGTVDYNGSVAQTIPGVTYYNLQTSTADTKTLGGDTVVQGVFTNNSGATFAPATFVFTLSGAGTPFVNNGTFTPGTSTISFSSASSTNVPALNYYNLTLTGGPRVLAGSGTIGIEGLFTPGAGAFTVTGSKVEFNGGAQTIPAFTFNDLVLSGSGAKTIPTATTVSVNEIDILNGPTLDIEGTAAINITKP